MFKPEHELHSRRKGRNTSLGLILGGFVLLVFLVTIVKLMNGQMIQGFDHTYRPALVTPDE
ncbi:hypothetical protein [Oceanicella sp. SM1341]|uniref:hypothetical protein n=1 Tax=Oceanicella sp. SM1341 TaxID=1548889 RepID=UPI000E4C1F4D|nr:hypothetical protein [Oceanicella sp. SM1341]